MTTPKLLIQSVFDYTKMMGISVTALAEKLDVPRDRVFKWKKG